MRFRTNKLYRVALTAIVLCMLSGGAWGSDKLHFQGFLTDDQGAPLDGILNVTLNIYNEAGDLQWTEIQSVEIDQGSLNVQVGAVEPLSAVLFETSPLFLGIAVGADPEMEPRYELNAVPYAFRAHEAQDAVGDIHPNSVTIPTYGEVIDDQGLWVGDPTGLQGEQGDQGEPGPQGDQGIQGASGDQGIQGEQGVQGDQGDQGDQGIQGRTGAQGAQGPAGITYGHQQEGVLHQVYASNLNELQTLVTFEIQVPESGYLLINARVKGSVYTKNGQCLVYLRLRRGALNMDFDYVGFWSNNGMARHPFNVTMTHFLEVSGGTRTFTVSAQKNGGCIGFASQEMVWEAIAKMDVLFIKQPLTVVE